jgi:hypothetical protein
MDGKDHLISPPPSHSHLQPFYGQQQQHLTQHSPSPSHLAGMQFHMDPPSASLLHNTDSNMGSASSGVSGPPPAVERKRGRPRKYGPDGAMKASPATAQHQIVAAFANQSAKAVCVLSATD